MRWLWPCRTTLASVAHGGLVVYSFALPVPTRRGPTWAGAGRFVLCAEIRPLKSGHAGLGLIHFVCAPLGGAQNESRHGVRLSFCGVVWRTKRIENPEQNIMFITWNSLYWYVSRHADMCRVHCVDRCHVAAEDHRYQLTEAGCQQPNAIARHRLP